MAPWLRRAVSGIALLAGMLLPGLVAPAAADLREKVEALAADLVRGLPEGRVLRVAVTDFPDLQGVTNDLGRFVAERITTRLGQTGRLTVIERRRLAQVLGELRFGMSDLVDPAKAKRLGQMLGVDALLVGSVSDLGTQVDVDVRLIDIESTRMLLGASTTISKDQVVASLLGSRGQGGAAAGGSGPAPAPPPSPTAESGGVSVGGFLFQARGCRRSASELVCTVTFTNEGRDERELNVLGQGNFQASRLIDNRGNQYPVIRIVIGGQSGSSVSERFVPQLPVNVHFATRDVHDDATSISVVVGIFNFGKTPVLRDVPVGR